MAEESKILFSNGKFSVGAECSAHDVWNTILVDVRLMVWQYALWNILGTSTTMVWFDSTIRQPNAKG